eukprot:TRINITY_DN4806_c0_g1_i1.p1 TRINITY_DN4806_c0_g1~~TRINITY_DN4806_c0_g1_i1.p1  ORF type:complete len:374 (+),score=87.50 TRINITY_DN4806_c0_g1_i1:43-1122(+)
MSDGNDPVSVFKRYLADPKMPKLFAAVGGLFAFFLMYGVVQERIMTKPYGEDADGKAVYFTTSAFLVLNNRLVTMCVAILLALWKGESTRPIAPLFAYGGVSLSNFIATWCQYEALKSISFPTQTLGKCGKIIPVLVLGTLGLGAKKYGKQDYIQGFLVTAGCLVFMLTGETKAPQTARDDSFFGLALMGLYLFSDGFTSTLQEKLFKGYSMSTENQMIYVNGSSAALSVLTLIASGQLWVALDFVTTYPALLFDAFGLSLCAMFGQQIIYYIIKEFGALIFATAMTTRQFAGILLSCALYAHPLSMGQFVGTAIVATAMYMKAINKSRKKKEPTLAQKVVDTIGQHSSTASSKGADNV